MNNTFFTKGRRLLALGITVCMVVSLSACVFDRITDVGMDDTSEYTDETTQTEEVTEEMTESTEATTEAATEEIIDIDIAWSEYANVDTDSEGYTIKQVLTISPWISEKDTELLNAAWRKVGKGYEFPSPSSLGFTGHSVSNYYTAHIDYDEIYYAVGYIEAFNETDGWDITQDNSRNFYISLGGANQYMTMQMMYSNGTRNYYDVFAPQIGAFGTNGGGWSPIYASMKSNKWGPVPFVIAFAVDKTPNHPDGNPSISECVFRFGDSEFTLVP